MLFLCLSWWWWCWYWWVGACSGCYGSCDVDSNGIGFGCGGGIRISSIAKLREHIYKLHVCVDCDCKVAVVVFVVVAVIVKVVVSDGFGNAIETFKPN